MRCPLSALCRSRSCVSCCKRWHPLKGGPCDDFHRLFWKPPIPEEAFVPSSPRPQDRQELAAEVLLLYDRGLFNARASSSCCTHRARWTLHPPCFFRFRTKRLACQRGAPQNEMAFGYVSPDARGLCEAAHKRCCVCVCIWQTHTLRRFRGDYLALRQHTTKPQRFKICAHASWSTPRNQRVQRVRKLCSYS